MARRELVSKLVTEGHLNVSERNQLRPGAVDRSEVAVAIQDVLTRSSFFPPHARSGVSSKDVYEGAILERLHNGWFRLHWQRHYAWDPYAVAENTSEDYDNLEQAIGAFIRGEWGDNIDSIEILPK